MSLSRYRQFYETVVRQDMLSKMAYRNVHEIPKIRQISVSGATSGPTGKGLDNPVASAFMLELITGQQARMTRIRRANARYRTREGFLEGAMVSLHGDQMYNFMDRLVNMVLPRVTDFNGLSNKSFDGNGNYAIGIRDINSFLEVEAQHPNMLNFRLDSSRGCGIHINTTAKTDAEAKLLLSAFRFPFAAGPATSGGSSETLAAPDAAKP